MKDSNEYDAQALPVSGPFAGLDPAQMPVIVDPKGERVKDDPNTPNDVATSNGFPGQTQGAVSYNIVLALLLLTDTHHVTIERGPGQKPTHRIVLGEDTAQFHTQLAQSLDAALLHHSTKEA